jgi:hypothetical protein
MNLDLCKSNLGRANDYLVIRDDWDVGRAYLIDGGPQANHWTWSVYCYAPAPSWLSGIANSLDEAKIALRLALERAEADGMKDFRDHPSYRGQAKRRVV